MPAGGNDVVRPVERGGNLENGNSASFDFFQGERYRVSARGIVGIVSMVGSGFNAVPRVFYSREMEPPFVAFFLDITTFIDATPSRILVSLPPPLLPPPLLVTVASKWNARKFSTPFLPDSSCVPRLEDSSG